MFENVCLEIDLDSKKMQLEISLFAVLTEMGLPVGLFFRAEDVALNCSTRFNFVFLHVGFK